MTALHRCPRCNGGAWWFDYEGKSVTAACLMCAERVPIPDGRRAAAEAELAALRGLHPKRGRKPKAERG